MSDLQQGDQDPVSPVLASRLSLLLSVVRSALLHPHRWLIGGVAVLIVVAGGQVIDGLAPRELVDKRLPSKIGTETTDVVAWPWRLNLGALEKHTGRRDAIEVLTRALDNPLEIGGAIIWNPRLVARPLLDVITPARRIVTPKTTWAETAGVWSRFLLAVIVWSIAGAILVRSTAADVARGESLPFRPTLGFGFRHTGSLLGAVLITLTFFGVLWGLAGLGGLFGRIPVVGPYTVSLLWFLPVLLGLLMVALVIGFVAGWPLMVATVGVEDSDAFDGFARGLGYLTDRPTLLAGYALLGTMIASVAAFLGWVVFSLALALAALSVSGGLGADVDGEVWESVSTDAGSSLVAGREVPSRLVATSTVANARQRRIGSTKTGVFGAPFPTAFLVFWIWVATTLFAGYLASVFWGMVTGIYLVVRHSADGIATSEVWLDSDDEDADSVETRAPVVEDAQENGDSDEG